MKDPKVLLCGDKVDASPINIGGRLILITFNEELHIEKDKDLEIYFPMIKFDEYIIQCGFKGLDDDDIYFSLVDIWRTKYAQKYKTVENLLCYPAKSQEFCDDFKKKLNLTGKVDDSMILKCLLNRRKSNKL